LVITVAGPRQVDEATGESKLKLRPLALAEGLLKLSETLLVDRNEAVLRAALEPAQLGIVMPGGVERAVRLVQAWAHHLAGMPAAEPALAGQAQGQVLFSLNLAKAYGRVERGPALRAVRGAAPELAAALAARRATGAVQMWQLGRGSPAPRPSSRAGLPGHRTRPVLPGRCTGGGQLPRGCRGRAAGPWPLA